MKGLEKWWYDMLEKIRNLISLCIKSFSFNLIFLDDQQQLMNALLEVMNERRTLFENCLATNQATPNLNFSCSFFFSNLTNWQIDD
jgi:hypothetical protein